MIIIFNYNKTNTAYRTTFSLNIFLSLIIIDTKLKNLKPRSNKKKLYQEKLIISSYENQINKSVLSLRLCSLH